MHIKRYSLGHKLLCAVQIHELRLESSGITAVSRLRPFLPAMRAENILCLMFGLCVSQERTLPWLLHQQGERLCYVRLCNDCCCSCYVSQERINVSAVLMAPVSTMDSRNSAQSVNSEIIGTVSKVSNTC